MGAQSLLVTICEGGSKNCYEIIKYLLTVGRRINQNYFANEHVHWNDHVAIPREDTFYQKWTFLEKLQDRKF